MKRPFCWFCISLCILVAGLYLGIGKNRPPCILKEGGGGLLLQWKEDLECLQGQRVVIGTVCAKDGNSFTINKLSFLDSANPDSGDSPSEKSMLLKRYKLICDVPKETDTASVGITHQEQYFGVEKGIARGQIVPNTIPVIGQKVMVLGLFSEYEKATNTGQFDSYTYYKSLNVIGRMKKTEILSISGRGNLLKEGLYRVRCLLHGRIQKVFDEDKAGVMCAVLLGEKTEVEKELRDLYRRNGIIHILSVSGLHISFLGLGVYKALRRLLSVKPSCVMSSLLMFLYGVMVGPSISSTRAIGMFILHMLALFLGRTYDAFTALCVMAAYTILKSPASVLNSGFYLSYGSVLGLLILLPIFEQKKCSLLLKSFFPGVSIFLFTVPIQLWFLYEIPINGILLNLLVVPGMTVVFGTGTLSLFPGLGFISSIAKLLLDIYELLASWFEQFPYHMWRPGKPSLVGVILYYGCMLGAFQGRSLGLNRLGAGALGSVNLLLRGFGSGILRVMNLAISGVGIRVGLLMLGIFFLTFLQKKQPGIAFLDVGQGLSCVITTGQQEVYLFDCGSSSIKNPGERILIPYLNYNGVRRIRKVFLSHMDNDHVNGLIELLTLANGEGIILEEFVLPPGYDTNENLVVAIQKYQEQYPIKISALCQGDDLELDGLIIHCLSPSREVWHSGEEDDGKKSSGNEVGKVVGGNEDSVCLYVELEVDVSSVRKLSGTNRLTILLTGDLEGLGERKVTKLLEASDLPPVQILQVAHHGSGKSTGEPFLVCMKSNQFSYTPLAIISCGRSNSYGHPHEETLERLKEIGAKVLRTDELGQIRIYCDQTGIVRCERGTGE